MKKITVCLLLGIYMCMYDVSQSYGATKICDLRFENNTTDTVGGCSILWNPSIGTPQYVSGHTGNAIRTSHNNDDGGGDFTITIGNATSTLQRTGELYVSFWYKQESNYYNCTGCNIKWLKQQNIGGTTAMEFINGVVQSTYVETQWQCVTDGFNACWNAGSTVTLYDPGSNPVTRGDWFHVEIFIKLSTGTNSTNADGVMWAKFNGKYIHNQTNVVTGLPYGTFRSPDLKATEDAPSGQGWWQIDDYEVWDGIPTTSPGKYPSQIYNILVE